MRVAVVLAAALLVTGCSWVHQELPWTAPPPAPVAAPAPAPVAPKPEPAPKPRARMERPAAPAPAAPVATAPTEPPVDNAARCHVMADNRADDAKSLGASAADQTRMRDETFRDCMQDSTK